MDAYTFDTAPEGYTGPVKLRPQDIAARDAADAAWNLKMVAMAQDETAHPEDRANAQAYLANRGIAWS